MSLTGVELLKLDFILAAQIAVYWLLSRHEVAKKIKEVLPQC